jgi:gamma-glutamylcyclotransferase (GGCT)/AIG2-like uncharacterized protein YtfP
MAPFYFAYGSNLGRSDWAAWCARNGFDAGCIRAVEPAVLPDVELVFDYHSQGRRGGVLNLRPRLGQCVDGMLFEVSAEGEEALDTKEGAPYVYRRQTHKAITANGAAIDAFTYEVCPERRCGFTAPHDLYLNVCRVGREQHGLDTRMLAHVARNEVAEYVVPGIFIYGPLTQARSQFGSFVAPAQSSTLSLGGRPSVDGEYVVPANLGTALAALDVIEGAETGGGAGGAQRRTLVTVNVGGRACRAWSYAPGERE